MGGLVDSTNAMADARVLLAFVGWFIENLAISLEMAGVQCSHTSKTPFPSYGALLPEVVRFCSQVFKPSFSNRTHS